MSSYRLIVQGRDTWSDERLDSLEMASEGAIVETVHLDPGNTGNLRLTVVPEVSKTAKERTRILVNLAIAGFPSARWVKVS